MKKDQNCRFCNILKGNYQYGNIDKPIIETNGFSMICSIGAFIPGWSLIISKEHDFSMRKFYKNKEFLEFFVQVKTLIEKTYKSKVIAFEHGANRSDSQTSCGTCHSHLHVLPFNDSLVSEITEDREWIVCEYNEIEKIVGDNEYLLYFDVEEVIQNSKCYIHILKSEISQYFRKVLANRINYAWDYSYKTNMLIEKTEETAKAYREVIK